MMNWLDIAIVAVVVFSALIGAQRGFVRQVFDVVGLIASYLVAIRYGNEFVVQISKVIPLTEWFPQWFQQMTLPGFSLGDVILRLLGFLILFGLVRWLFSFAGNIVHGIFSLPLLNWVNGTCGLLLGLLQGVLFSLILVALAKLIGLPFLVKALEESTLAVAISAALPVIYEQMKTLLFADLYL